MSRYQWSLQKQIERGHRWFKDERSGRIACADDSGRTPDNGDDGVLWLSKFKSLKLEDAGVGAGIRVYATVTKERDGSESAVLCNVDEALYLMREHGMKLEAAGTALKIAELS